MDKVRNACGLLMGGQPMEAAALACGFKASGRNSASAALIRAAKRLGLADGFQVQHPNRGGAGRSDAGLAEVVPAVVIPFVPVPALPGGVSVVDLLPVRAVVGAGDTCLAAARAARKVAKFEWSRLNPAARWSALSPRQRQARAVRAVAMYGQPAKRASQPVSALALAGDDQPATRRGVASRRAVVAALARFERARRFRGVLRSN